MKGRTHEKWLQSREGSKPWYCILPNGEVRIDDGKMTLVGRVDPRYHENPLWFVEKKTPPQRSIAEDFQGELFAQAGVLDGGRERGDIYFLGFIGIGEEKVGEEEVQLEPGRSVTLFFTIEKEEEKMVNFWVEGVDERDLTLRIQGGPLPAKGYSSAKEGVTGESVSLRLTPGTYELTVEDETGYGVRSIAEGSFRVPVHYEIVPFRTQEIVGRISIEKSPETMPVRMRVAEFDSAGKRIDRVSDLNALKPDNPLWVVMHGREDNPDSGKMTELARALTEAGHQVVTLDWAEAARDNMPHLFGLQGEQWIEAVAEKAYQFLKSAGIPGGNVYLGGHSWAALVAFEIAERYKGDNGFGVQAIVALDPAKDPTLKIGYDASQVDFSAVSRVSWGFHSSFWGSVPRTMTGGRAIEIRSPGVIHPTSEHGIAVTTFANLVRLQRMDPQNPIGSQFSLDALSNPNAPFVPCDTSFEGWLWVDSDKKYDQQGDSYLNAIPRSFTLTNPDDDIPDRYFLNTVVNLEQTLRSP